MQYKSLWNLAKYVWTLTIFIIYYVLQHFSFFSLEVQSANAFFLLSDIAMDKFMPNYINWTINLIQEE